MCAAHDISVVVFCDGAPMKKTFGFTTCQVALIPKLARDIAAGFTRGGKVNKTILINSYLFKTGF